MTSPKGAPRSGGYAEHLSEAFLGPIAHRPATFFGATREKRVRLTIGSRCPRPRRMLARRPRTPTEIATRP
jgi:hypothetical protein